MNAFIRSTAAASALALGATFSPLVLASNGVASEEVRERIRLTIAQLPVDRSNRQVTARVEDGRYVISGFVDGIEGSADARRALAGIDGLDQDLLDIRIIRQ